MKCGLKKSARRVATFGPAVAALATALACPWQPSPQASVAAIQKNSKAFNHRDARKAMRVGKYEKAGMIYEVLTALNASDFKARLGASFAYLKMSDFARCFDAATGVLKAEPGNARAHALAGIALLLTGYVKLASAELQLAVNLDSREALAYGGSSEVDYSEGRIDESRRKSIYARKLDPDEPGYLMSYARASSRAEDFREAANAYELFLQIAPEQDAERRDRIRGLISFYRQLAGLRVHQVGGAESAEVPFYLGRDRRPYLRVKLNRRAALFVIDTGSGFTVISKEAARRLGVSEIAKGGKSQGVGGTGKFPIVYGLIGSIEIGAVTLRMVPCFVRSFHGTVSEPQRSLPKASLVCRFCPGTSQSWTTGREGFDSTAGRGVRCLTQGRGSQWSRSGQHRTD